MSAPELTLRREDVLRLGWPDCETESSSGGPKFGSKPRHAESLADVTICLGTGCSPRPTKLFCFCCARVSSAHRSRENNARSQSTADSSQRSMGILPQVRVTRSGQRCGSRSTAEFSTAELSTAERPLRGRQPIERTASIAENEDLASIMLDRWASFSSGLLVRIFDAAVIHRNERLHQGIFDDVQFIQCQGALIKLTIQ